MPPAILHSDFDCDLRLGFRDAIPRLFDGLRLFGDRIVATPPIEWLPAEKKSCDADVTWNKRNVIHSEITNGDAEVGNVFRFRDAAVVLGLLLFELRLLNLGPALLLRALVQPAEVRSSAAVSGIKSTRKTVARSRPRSWFKCSRWVATPFSATDRSY